MQVHFVSDDDILEYIDEQRHVEDLFLTVLRLIGDNTTVTAIRLNAAVYGS